MDIVISVVIPTYKRTELLSRCLDALHSQSLHQNEFEVIVVSDGPDEATHALLENRKTDFTSITYLHLQEKKGPAAARNLGWKNAKGSLVAFTDDDCVPERNWLKAACTEFHENKTKVFTGKVIVPVSGKPTDHELNTCHLQTAEFITANCFCAREALVATGGFDERFGLAWREDSDLHFRFLSLGLTVSRLETAVVVHPVRKAPWGFSMKEQKKGLYNALLFKKYPELYRQRIQAAPAWNYYIIVLSAITLLVAAITGNAPLALVALATWLLLVVFFIRKRLQMTTHDPAHVAEMIVTSLAIPFLSVYWQLYGAVKFRVWFL